MSSKIAIVLIAVIIVIVVGVVLCTIMDFLSAQDIEMTGRVISKEIIPINTYIGETPSVQFHYFVYIKSTEEVVKIESITLFNEVYEEELITIEYKKGLCNYFIRKIK